MTRLERLAERLEEPLLVTKPVNVRYLTGLESSNAALLVERDRVRLYTDFRYLDKAREVDRVELVRASRPVTTDLARLLSGRVGFEAEHLPYAQYALLRDAGLELVPRTGLVEEQRAVKEDAELELIRRAAASTTRVFEALAGERFTGRTEKDVAWRVTELLHEHGADAPAFETIVASGEVNGARPHADTGDRVIQEGTFVTVDAAAAIGGYASDCTRTFATGEPPERLLEAYDVCLRAQLAGLAAVRAGVTGREADAAARAVIEEAGFGEYFGHGLGHGLGLEVHEAPSLRPESPHTLAARNVATVEPGIYMPGVGGMRIEDLVIVTEDGSEVLTPVTKELLRVE